jgi:hypothetical protein
MGPPSHQESGSLRMNRDIASTVPAVPHPRHRDSRDTSTNGTLTGTVSGTTSLKTLAKKVFERDNQRDGSLTPERLSQCPESLCSGTAGNNDDGSDRQERAAIMEYDGGLTRREAERLTLLSKRVD